MVANSDVLRGQWNQLRGKVKEKWGQLTDEDLTIHGGNLDQMVGKIQKRTGESREEIEKFLHNLMGDASSAVSQAVESARDFAENLGDRWRDSYGYAADRARASLDNAEDMVRQNPGISVATSIGVGFVAGLIIGLSLRSR